MGMIKITGVMMLCALFGIALITYAVNFGIDNNTGIKLGDDENLVNTNTNLSDTIEEFYVAANTSFQAGQKSTISSQTEASEGGTQFKVTPTSSLGMFRNTLKSGFEKIFGSGSGFNLLFTALIGFLIFVIGLYFWKAWRGNP